MQTVNEPYEIEENGWTVRVQPPKDTTAPARTMLLLHGRMGNETVMWIFAGKLPKNYWLIAPRAPVRENEGYSWLPHTGGLNTLEEFAAASDLLLEAFESWAKRVGAPYETFDVMGFSQGAAIAYVLAALHPERVERIAGLAGFLPRDMQGRYSALSGKQIYVAHGTADNIIPVRFAQQAVQTLQDSGAQVTYCESDVGHKMSADCLRGLEAFFK